jgi:hypothetical protein
MNISLKKILRGYYMESNHRLIIRQESPTKKYNLFLTSGGMVLNCFSGRTSDKGR